MITGLKGFEGEHLRGIRTERAGVAVNRFGYAINVTAPEPGDRRNSKSLRVVPVNVLYELNTKVEPCITHPCIHIMYVRVF